MKLDPLLEFSLNFHKNVDYVYENYYIKYTFPTWTSFQQDISNYSNINLNWFSIGLGLGMAKIPNITNKINIQIHI